MESKHCDKCGKDYKKDRGGKHREGKCVVKETIDVQPKEELIVVNTQKRLIDFLSPEQMKALILFGKCEITDEEARKIV